MHYRINASATCLALYRLTETVNPHSCAKGGQNNFTSHKWNTYQARQHKRKRHGWEHFMEWVKIPTPCSPCLDLFRSVAECLDTCWSILFTTNHHYPQSVETLHTILLGPYKYLCMNTLSGQQKEEVLARMAAFDYWGFDGKVLGNVVYHHMSFVGRDYKAWAQLALFIIGPYLSDAQ